MSTSIISNLNPFSIDLSNISNKSSSSSSKIVENDSYVTEYENSMYKNMITLFRQFIYYSPLILTIIMVMIGFVFQSLVVLVYLGAIIVFSAIRAVVIQSNIDSLKKSFKEQLEQDGPRNAFCNIYDYDKIGSGFVIFYATFTISYIVLPMMFFSIYNFYIFIPLLIYLLLIVVYNVTVDKCVRWGIAMYEFHYGFFTALLVLLSLHYTNNDKLLVLSPIQPNSNFCSMPNNQTFKCSVYKNGELVSSSLSSQK